MADIDDTARALRELCARLPARNRLLELGELVDVLCANDPAQCMAWFLQVVDAANGDRLIVRHENGHRVKPGAADRFFLVRDVGAWLEPEGWAVTFADGENAAAPPAPDQGVGSPAIDGESSGPAAHVHGAPWTPEQIAEARAMRDSLKAKGRRDYVARTATYFGVDKSRLRTVLKENPKHAANPVDAPSSRKWFAETPPPPEIA